MIGSCDYCGEYCFELGVNAVESFEFNGWIPPSAIERHVRLVEARLECSGGDPELPGSTHVGPWHGRRGEPLDTCRNCSSRSQMDLGTWGASLDHGQCQTCWAGVTGGWVLRALLGDRPPGEPAPIDDGDSADVLRSTDSADRATVEAAFHAYLGTGTPPIRWAGSPAEVARSFTGAIDNARTALETGYDYGTPPWSIWRAGQELNSILIHDDDEHRRYEERIEAARSSGAAICRALAATLSALDPDRFGDRTLVEELMADAGQFDVRTPAFWSAHRSWPLEAGDDALLGLLDALRASAGPLVVLPKEIVVSDRPLVLAVDDAGRPHAEDGPAIAYGDGFRVFAWHGRVVPEWVITDPGRITPELIDEEENVEVRSVLVERFGPERLIREGGAELVHEDETGRLWRRQVGTARDRRGRLEPVVMVEVINATPEPDGTRRTYFLRVPPSMSRARDAVAWTFSMEGREYAPAIET